jgi:hypothetical protein
MVLMGSNWKYGGVYYFDIGRVFYVWVRLLTIWQAHTRLLPVKSSFDCGI